MSRSALRVLKRLILSGKDDVFFAKEEVKNTAAGIPNAILNTCCNCGHNLTAFYTRDVIKEIQTLTTFLLGTSAG